MLEAPKEVIHNGMLYLVFPKYPDGSGGIAVPLWKVSTEDQKDCQ